MKDNTPTDYVTRISYAPHGGYAAFQVAGARTERWCYNIRMQPVGMRLGEHDLLQ